ncbi:MAG: nucleotide sugar dehydrogenase, partial [Alphaproteobacteria bacterium]
MKISVIGAGYVGLVAATCFATFGLKVTCIDTSTEKIEKLKLGEIPIYEPSLKELLLSALQKKDINFATSYDSIEHSDAVIIAVGTPSAEDGSADLSYVYNALGIIMDIVEKHNKHLVVVTKATVPIGTAKKMMELVNDRSLNDYISIVSNPEFLREGSAVSDFLKPDRIVLGASNGEGLSVANRIYAALIKKGVTVVETDNTT